MYIRTYIVYYRSVVDYSQSVVATLLRARRLVGMHAFVTESPVNLASTASPLHAGSNDGLVPQTEQPPIVTPSISSSFEFDARGQRGDNAGSMGRATLTSSIVNLTNTIVGGGILALPYAFASSGYLLGTLFLLVFGLASFLGLFLFSQCAFKLGLPSSFRKVTATATHALSPLLCSLFTAPRVVLPATFRCPRVPCPLISPSLCLPLDSLSIVAIFCLILCSLPSATIFRT